MHGPHRVRRPPPPRDPDQTKDARRALKNNIKGRNPTRDDFKVVEVPLRPLEWAECRVRTLWLSCDPSQRKPAFRGGDGR